MVQSLRLTLAQLNPVLGDIEGNAGRIMEIWKDYADNSDLILFPELFLCGYPPEDLSHNRAFLSALRHKIYEICTESKHLSSAALVPTIWVEDNSIYNAALLIEHGKIAHVFKKHHLPNYTVFDEVRNFAAGAMPEPYLFHGVNLGIMICEDLWHEDVSLHLKKQGAELLIAINGSPFDVYQKQTREGIARACITATDLSLIYLNMIGGQDELVFDGGSFIMHRMKQIIHQSPFFEEDIFCVTVTNDTDQPQHQVFDVTQEQGVYNPSHLENPHALKYAALKMGLRDYVRKNGFTDVLLGLSGGIDSALVAAIAVDALGADHVRCVMLPSEFTSQDSLDDAKECAVNLGLGSRYDIITIKDAVRTFETLIPDLKGLAHENTQSRLRGVILMALSNMTGAMLLTTGNKSEMAVGYCTLYGDMNGGFNPLKDVYKTDVYHLAHWRNRVSPVIPERILTKAPTAELRAGQTDQDSLPPYDVLDDMLFLLIECDNVDWNNAPPALLALRERCAVQPETLARVAKLLKNAEYKRYQAAPGTRLSIKAFGRNRRYPMTNHFVNRIEKSL